MDNLKEPSKLIDGIKITSLKQIKDSRGAVFHVIKNNSKTFHGFGEAYFSKINENVIKGWKYHKTMTQNFCIPFGKLKLVLFDNRKNSPTYKQINEIIIDDCQNYNRVTIPEKIYYSFKCISSNYCLLLNISNIVHDPKESEKISLLNGLIPYNWQLDE